MARGPCTAIVLAATLSASALAIASPPGPKSASERADARSAPLQKMGDDGRPEARSNGRPEARSAAIPGSYIVVYKDSVSEVGRKTRAREKHLGFDRDHLYRHALKGFSAELTPEQVRELRADPTVAFVSPNERVELHASVPLAPGEPTPPTGTRRMLSATTTTVRQAGANVAVLDTGVQLDHPDLNAAAGTDCLDPGTPPDDPDGHGTHVAGIIGAKNNGSGVTGVAPNTKIYAVRVNGGAGESTATVICGIDWVTANHEAEGIEVANMSLGTEAIASFADDETCDTSTDPQRIAICNSTADGVRYVVSAGNNAHAFDLPIPRIGGPGEPGQVRPAAYPEVLTVTAVADSDGAGGGTGANTSCGSNQADDTPDSFTNFASTAEGRAHTIAAPGVCINSTLPGSTWGMKSGTSQAAPHVTGAVALCVREAGVPGPCAGETPAETIEHMRGSAEAYTALRPSHGFAGDPLNFGHMVHGPGALELIKVTNTADQGPGSLRAAITAANADPDGNRIFFAPRVTGTIELQSALPNLSEDVMIKGPGADRLRVARSGTAGPFRIFWIDSGTTAEISQLTIAGGSDVGVGGGVVNEGTLALTEAEVRENTGGGIANTGDLTVRRSTISDNHTAGAGGAGIVGFAGSLAIHESTISGNAVSAGAPGNTAGGVLASGTITIANSTIAGNTNPNAGNAANLGAAGATVKSTIVANPLGGGSNCVGTVTSQGFNLESTDTCGLTQATDLTDADPQLGALADNGGPTETMLPSGTSPALDKGLAGAAGSDQRGQTRTVDVPSVANAAGGDGTDIGAVELRPALRVTNTNDSGAGSLREAMTAANDTAGPDVVSFAPGVTGTINLQSPLPPLTSSVEIDGPGLEQMTVRRDAGGDYAVLGIVDPDRFDADVPNVEISGLTIANGRAAGGAGVTNGGAQLLLERVAISSNAAVIDAGCACGGSGGGIFNSGRLTVKGSTVAGNTAGAGGGAIHDFGGVLTVLNSTISGNSSVGGPGLVSGGGIQSFNGRLRMRNSTVTGNTVSAQADPFGSAGGVVVYSESSQPRAGASQIIGSTIAGNTHQGSHTANLGAIGWFETFVKSTIIADPLGGGPDCTANAGNSHGFITSGGFNLESADTCSFGPSDKKNTNPQLGALADNGGPTRTMALPVTSPAVDAGVSTGGPNDQRDKARAFDHAGAPNAPGGDGSDIGAFELQAMRLLSVTTNGSGTGTVSSAPAMIDCGATCEGSLEDGASVTLTATPGANTQPAQWSGCDSVNGANECVVAMTSAKNVTATFNLVRRALTVTKAGSGSGTVSSSPAAIDCGATCAANLDHGTAVTLAGTQGAGSQPALWSGCDSVNGANECVVAMTAAKDVTATFDTLPASTPPGSGNPPAPSGPALLPGACANQVLGGAAANRLTGTPAGDKLVGGKKNDTLTGLAGDDCLDGRAGDDNLDGGDGNDKLSGGSGNDKLAGGKGKDRLDGGAGNDKLTGGPAKNTYSAGAGNDSVNAANKIVETVSCGAGRDSATVDKKDKVRGCERVRRR